jgi:hypothetical protein
MKVIRISYGTQDLILEEFDEIGELLKVEDFEAGEKLTINVEEIDSDKFKNLPEWDGF